MWGRARRVVEAVWAAALGTGAVVMWRLATIPRIGGQPGNGLALFLNGPGLSAFKYGLAVALSVFFLVVFGQFIVGLCRGPRRHRPSDQKAAACVPARAGSYSGGTEPMTGMDQNQQDYVDPAASPRIRLAVRILVFLALFVFCTPVWVVACAIGSMASSGGPLGRHQPNPWWHNAAVF